jgi:hypothetical protein
MPPLYLYARVHLLLCATAHETSGAASTRSSLRPLFLKRAKEKMQTSGAMRRESAKTISTVIASEAKQSIATSRTERWIASLRSQ